MHNKSTEQKRATLLIILLLIMVAGCLLWIVLRGTSFFDSTLASSSEEAKVIADIYQDGVLLQSIPLNMVTEAYTFTITGENGAENEIEVRPGSIGILSATCPDKLCVHQGFISSSLLPITCLPNHLVIQVRVEDTSMNAYNPAKATEAENEVSDIIAY